MNGFSMLVAPVAFGLFAGCSPAQSTSKHRDQLSPLVLAAPDEPTLHAGIWVPNDDSKHGVVVLLEDTDGSMASKDLLDAIQAELISEKILVIRLRCTEMSFVERRRALRRWIEAIELRPDVKANSLALVGHGWGGAIAARCAAAFNDRINCIALLASPGLPGRLNDVDSIKSYLSSLGAPPDLIREAISARGELIGYASQDVNEVALKQAAEDSVQSIVRASGQDYRAVTEVLAEAKDPEWRYLMSYDPRMTMPRLGGVEVLAIQGTEDAQFDGGANLHALGESARLRAVAIDTRLLPGLDHGMARMNADGSRSIDEGVVHEVVEWTTKRIGQPEKTKGGLE